MPLTGAGNQVDWGTFEFQIGLIFTLKKLSKVRVIIFLIN